MTESPAEKSPLAGLSREAFKGRTTPNEYTVTVGTTLVTLLRNNPNRLHWIVLNEGIADVRISNDPTITASTGWLLVANGGVASMTFDEDGEGVGYPVFGISGVAGNVVRVREVIRL